MVAVLYVLTNHSSTSVQLRCEEEGESADVVFARLEIFSPWVMLWSDSGGNLWTEDEDGFSRFFGGLEVFDAAVYIKRTPDAELIGKYSRVSQRLNMQIGGNEFSGTCVEI